MQGRDKAGSEVEVRHGRFISHCCLEPAYYGSPQADTLPHFLLDEKSHGDEDLRIGKIGFIFSASGS